MTTEKQSLPELAVLGALWRSKWIILALTILAAGAGYVATSMATPNYQAEASLLFRFDREYSPRNLATDNWQGEPIRVNLDGAIHNDLEILGSRRLLLETLSRMGATSVNSNAEGAQSLDQQLAATRNALSIRRVEGTSIARLSFTHSDPDYAAAFLATLIDTHLELRGPYLNWSPASSISEVVAWTEAQLSDAQRNLNAFRAESGISDAASLRADLQGRHADLRLELLRLTPDSPASEHSEIVSGIGVIEAELARLAEHELRLEALEGAVDFAAEQYRQARDIFAEQELSERLAAAQGPSIIPLDQPATNPDPVGLSAVATAVLSGAVGFALASLLGLWLSRTSFGSPARGAAPAPQNAPALFVPSRQNAVLRRVSKSNRAKSSA